MCDLVRCNWITRTFQNVLKEKEVRELLKNLERDIAMGYIVDLLK